MLRYVNVNKEVKNVGNEITREYFSETAKHYPIYNSRKGMRKYFRQRSLEILTRKGFNVLFDDGDDIVILHREGELYRPKIFEIIGLLEASSRGDIFVSPQVIKGDERYELFFQTVTKMKEFLER